MALIVMGSPGGSPGVTTAALAASMTWPRGVLVAECDPRGGAVLPGYLAGRAQQVAGGLLEAALAVAHHQGAGAVEPYLVALPGDTAERRRMLLAGLRDPRQAAQLDQIWPRLADALRQTTAEHADVLADIGHIGDRETPYPLIGAADLLVVVLRPTLRQVAAARPRLEVLGCGQPGGSAVPIALCVTGGGPYTPAEVGQSLWGLPVLTELPFDARTAWHLSDGTRPPRGNRTPPLLKAAARLAKAIRHRTARPARAATPPIVAATPEAATAPDRAVDPVPGAEPVMTARPVRVAEPVGGRR